MRAERASRGVSDVSHIDRDVITTSEDLTMAAEAYQRGYVAVKEEGRREGLQEAAEAYQRRYVAVKEEGRQDGRQGWWLEGWKEGWLEGWREGARAKEIDFLCELLQPAIGREFADELRALLDDDELRARLDPNIVFDLRLRYGTNPEELQQALRDRLKT